LHDADAASWATRLDEEPLDPKGRAELDAWLQENPRHVGELLRAQATLSYLDRGRALAGVGSIETDASRMVAYRIGRRQMLGGAGAALAATFAGFTFLRQRGRSLSTRIGEVHQITLADGSSATLNSASRVSVRFADVQRTIQLDQGEAWFRVAPDKARPFVVEAGDARVRAVGTAFSVRRRDSGIEVLVTEGVVETWVYGQATPPQRVAAGSLAFVSSHQAQIEVAHNPQEIDRSLSWRTGELALDGETLAYAVEEINRYNVRKIELADPSLGQEQIAGYFRTNEPENFARAIASMVGGRVVAQDDVILIERGAVL